MYVDLVLIIKYTKWVYCELSIVYIYTINNKNAHQWHRSTLLKKECVNLLIHDLYMIMMKQMSCCDKYFGCKWCYWVDWLYDHRLYEIDLVDWLSVHRQGKWYQTMRLKNESVNSYIYVNECRMLILLLRWKHVLIIRLKFEIYMMYTQLFIEYVYIFLI